MDDILQNSEEAIIQLDLSLQGITLTRSPPIPSLFSFSFLPFRNVVFGLDKRMRANWSYYAATSVSSTNNLRGRRCCQPTARCNKSRDHVDLPEKLHLRVSSTLRYSVWQII